MVQPGTRCRDGLRAGLQSGTINAICSDHQPHDLDAKLAPFPSSEPGISGLESLLPLALRLVDEGVLNLSQAIASITQSPANIVGLSASLEKDSRADVCIFDPEQYWPLTAETMASEGKNSPFLGWEFKGRVTHTLLAGHISFDAKD